MADANQATSGFGQTQATKAFRQLKPSQIVFVEKKTLFGFHTLLTASSVKEALEKLDGKIKTKVQHYSDKHGSNVRIRTTPEIKDDALLLNVHMYLEYPGTSENPSAPSKDLEKKTFRIRIGFRS